jgi:octaprenyl-diphosphate synthase
LRSAAPEQRELVARAVRDGNGDFGAIARIVADNGSLAYSLKLAQREADDGRLAVESLPPSDCRDSLIHLLAFAVDRDR